MASGRTYINLLPGDPAPWFFQNSTSSENYAFDTAAGRYIVLCFYGSTQNALGRAALEKVFARRHFFDDDARCFFGVSLDPGDKGGDVARERLPGIRFFWDFDAAVGRLYGSVAREVDPSGQVSARQMWLVIDPTLRVLKSIPFAPDGSDGETLFDYLDSLPPPERFAGIELQAPILFLPNVFEPELCAQLIALYEAGGGEESGFMREVDGKTVMIHDHAHKRRKDFFLETPEIIKTVQRRILRRINPELVKAYNFNATRMERYMVGCYAAEDGGHFRAHRDNTTRGTAHRRFAVSINLNGDFEGGEVSFPEYGRRGFKAPPGGAVIFPCALLHAVAPVRSGRRYAFLPFLYDDAAALQREQNQQFLEGGGSYKSGLERPVPAS